jgi:phytoene dehydrogenase-like protein
LLHVRKARAIVDAMVRGIVKLGSEVRLRSHVEEVVVDRGRAVGVKLAASGSKPGAVIRARKAVISNASIWDTFGFLVSPEHLSPSFLADAKETPAVESFMHLHLAIPAAGLGPFIGHHAIIIDSKRDIAEPGNTVMVSVPTSWSPELAPDGWHIVHAYTLEEYDRWPELAKNRQSYDEAKEVAAVPLYAAVRSMFPDLDARLKHPHAIAQIGSPLTHARYCRRHKGTYGPGIVAGQAEFPWPRTPIQSFMRVGDSVFPGIGVPAAAASGMIAATSLVGFRAHAALVDRLFPET